MFSLFSLRICSHFVDHFSHDNHFQFALPVLYGAGDIHTFFTGERMVNETDIPCAAIRSFSPSSPVWAECGNSLSLVLNFYVTCYTEVEWSYMTKLVREVTFYASNLGMAIPLNQIAADVLILHNLAQNPLHNKGFCPSNLHACVIGVCMFMIEDIIIATQCIRLVTEAY